MQLQQIEPAESTHYARHKRDKQSQKSLVRDCKYCGSSHKHGKCPANGKTCQKCSKVGHFAKVCKSKEKGKADHSDKGTSKALQMSAEDTGDSDESIYSLHHTRPGRKQYYVEVAIETPSKDKTVPIRFQLDSGASCSTLRLSDYKKTHKRITTTIQHTFENVQWCCY